MTQLGARLRQWDRRLLGPPLPRTMPDRASVDTVDRAEMTSDPTRHLDAAGAGFRWPRWVLVTSLVVFVVGLVWAAAARSYAGMVVMAVAAIGPARWLLRHE